MVDELFDRSYQLARADLHAGVDRAFLKLAAAVENAFKVLNRIEYSAPWADKQSKACTH